MPPHLTRGARVGERYRLEAELGHSPDAHLWRARDERLERDVALRVYADPSEDDGIHERVGVAASLTHPRVVRLFDSGHDRGSFYTVSELLPGSLAWARLPLSPTEAVEVGEHVAEALAYAHQRGVAHGRLHRGNVLLSEQGAKLGDFAADTRTRGSTDGDLVALGDLLYELVTGRDPSARHPGRPLADDPPGLAELIARLRSGAETDAAAVARQLARLSRPEGSTGRSRLPRVAAVAAGVLAVAALAFVATRLGGVTADRLSSSDPPAIAGTPYEIATVADHDPLGDGREGRATVEKLYDGDPQTFWSTERYSGGADFSGLKDGVGVILDLGTPRTVGAAQLLLPASGCSFQIRYSENRSRDLDDWQVAGEVEDAGRRGALTFDAATARWWMVWVTRLTDGVPGVRSGFACAVAEVGLYPP